MDTVERYNGWRLGWCRGSVVDDKLRMHFDFTAKFVEEQAARITGRRNLAVGDKFLSRDVTRLSRYAQVGTSESWHAD